MSHLVRRITNIFFAFVLAVMSVNLSGVLTLQSAHAADTVPSPVVNGKITICHSHQPNPSNGNGQGPVNNPYDQKSVSVDATDGDGANDHTSHTGVNAGEATHPFRPGDLSWGDIIPAYPAGKYKGKTYPAYAGLNWNAEGQAIYYNGCSLPQDATANITVSDPTCDSAGIATVTGLANAALNGTLDQTVGTHTAVFTTTAGHYFPNYQTTKSISYTIIAKLSGDRCITKDATASVTPTPATCNADGSATFTVNHATLNGALDTTPGAHTATFTAEPGHVFSANNSTTLEVPYTIESKHTGRECAGEKPKDEKEQNVVTETPICSPNGGGTVTSWTEERTRTYELSGSEWVAGEWSDWTKVAGSETTIPATNEQCPPTECPKPGVVSESELLNLTYRQMQNNSLNIPEHCIGNGGAGGETPTTPQTSAAKPVVAELPQTGADAGNPFVKLATVLIAGITTYGAMFFIVNRRELSKK